MATDNSLDQALVSQMIEPALFAVALAGGIDQGEVAWFVQWCVRVILGCEIQFFQRAGDILGKAGANEAAGGDGVTGTDQAHRLASADDFTAFGNTE